jgi:tetratricopeptide (TPR) repeat protein
MRQQQAVPPLADTEKPSRFSLRRLFGGGSEEPSPTTDQATPAPRLEQFQRQPAPQSESFRADAQRAQQMQMQREMAQASDMQDDAVTPAGYASRGNSGLQLRPATNRPASLLGGDQNNMSQATHRGISYPNQPLNSMARGPQNQSNNAFSRGRETMQRLAQNQAPTANSSQPVFVSDGPSVSAPRSSQSNLSQPIISAMSPEVPLQPEQPGIAQSEPAPLVVENRAATRGRQPMPVAKNPVPPRPEPNREVPAAQPSERVVQLLSEANSYSQSAETEEQLTQVVQMCRHALAIDNSPQAVEYSKNLAGWALNRRGEMRADAGRDRDAMLDFEDAIHTDPSRWRAVHNRGVMLAQQGQFAAAFDDFNRTLELNPKFAKAYSNRAALYTQAGDLAAALDDYRQAITFDPDLAVAHKGRGRVCHIVGNFEEALQHYDAAALLAPNDAHIALGRADLLTDMGRYASAAEGYQQTIAIDPTHAAAYRSLAWVQATCSDETCRNAEHALANAEMALQVAGQEDDVTLDTLAAAQANAGDFAAAQATQSRAIELANAEDRPLYQERLALYQQNQPFRIEPPQPIRQATYRR